MFGARCLDQITATDIETLMRQVIATRVQHANHQAGQYAGEHFIGAIRVDPPAALAARGPVAVPLEHGRPEAS
jgi:hypothetical protein